MKTLNPLLQSVLIFIFLFLESTFAGAPPIQWQKTFGGTENDVAYSVQQTTDGGYIIAGTTHSFGAGFSDVYLIKTEHNGNIVWQKTFGGGLHDSSSSVRQTSDGGYIIAGTTNSYGNMYKDVYLIKTEPNGNLLWQNTFGANFDNDYGYSVLQTSDGGYIIAGGTCFYHSLESDVYLVKTDSNGNSEWQRTLYRSGGNSASSVQQTSDGGFIIVGSSSSSGIEAYDVYLIKYDHNEHYQWEKTFGGKDGDYGRSVQQTFDGGYIIAGSTLSYGTGGLDVYLIKTDPDGNRQWQKTFGGSESDSGYSVRQTSDGGYIIAGSTSSYGAGGSDIYLIRTDPNGNSQWQKTFGGSNHDYSHSLQKTSDSGYIIAGYTKSYGAGDNDVYLVKLSCERTWLGDLNCNGSVYFDDLALLTGQWLQPPGIQSADIYPEPGDGIVNGFDFAAFANDWLQTTLP